MKSPYLRILVAVLALAFIACGGGGGGSSKKVPRGAFHLVVRSDSASGVRSVLAQAAKLVTERVPGESYWQEDVSSEAFWRLGPKLVSRSLDLRPGQVSEAMRFKLPGGEGLQVGVTVYFKNGTQWTWIVEVARSRDGSSLPVVVWAPADGPDPGPGPGSAKVRLEIHNNTSNVLEGGVDQDIATSAATIEAPQFEGRLVSVWFKADIQMGKFGFIDTVLGEPLRELDPHHVFAWQVTAFFRQLDMKIVVPWNTPGVTGIEEDDEGTWIYHVFLSDSMLIPMAPDD